MTPIFISSSCIPSKNIEEVLTTLITNGITHIELSGGTAYRPDLTDILKRYQRTHDLTYKLHNYFPPPPHPFVLNIASNTDEIQHQTLAHITRALELCETLHIQEYSLHAGYRLEIPLSQLGKPIEKTSLIPLDVAIENTCKTYEKITQLAQTKGIHLYLENNVCSKANFDQFGEDPFLATDTQSIAVLRKQLQFDLLLDIAHLKVSAKTKHLDFDTECRTLLEHATYLHLSDNDGTADTNHPVTPQTSWLPHLKTPNTTQKAITLEVYSTMEEILSSKKTVETFLHD